MPRLKLHFLGQPHIELDGARVEFDTNKATALLAYLALNAQSHTREALATLLWPEYEQGRALANLRRTLWTLNSAGLKLWLEAEGDTITLQRGDQVRIDVDEFHAQVGACQDHSHPALETCPACVPALAAAADLYRGDFLAGFTLRDSPEFDDWQSLQTEILRREAADVLQRLVQGYVAERALDIAINYGRRWLALDPLHEPAHRQLMELYARTKGRSAAVRQYEECVRVLDQELGVPPEAETTALCERIRAGELSLPEQKAAPSHPSSPVAMYNLPAQPTPFVGRQEELARVAQLLGDPACRLLTLVGPGGIGKTRLAVEAGRAQAASFAQGVCFVPLGGVSSGAYVIPALATALALPPQHRSKDLRSDVLNFVGSKQILLILDSFEHLVEDAPLSCEILRAAPRVKILVTSRERLNLQDEWALELGGMTYPAVLAEEDPLNYSAVALFLQSAQRARVGFAPSASDMRCILRICQLVEGMPLGIELAAAWVRALSCEQTATEIERDLDFLTTSMRDLPEGHRSLRAVFDSSWRRLAEGDRLAFARLCVFRGGFTREAAEAVGGADLVVLSSLVDKSFVRRDPDERYSIHELLRQFGEEELDRLPTARDAAHSLHSQYYLRYLQSVEDGLKGLEQRAIVLRIKHEIDNVLVAWQWAVEHGEWFALNGTLTSLLIFYDTASWFREGLRAFEFAAERLRSEAITDEQQAVLGRLITRQGVFTMRLDRIPRARELLAEGLEIARRKGTPADASTALNYLGWLAYLCGDLTEGRRLLQESVDLCRPLGDRFAAAISLNNLGGITEELGDYAQAQRLLEESLAIKRDLGDRRGVAFALGDLCSVAMNQGDYAQAMRLCHEGNTIMLEIGDRWAQPSFVFYLGTIDYFRGDYVEAEQQMAGALEAMRAAGFDTKWSQASAQLWLGRVYCATGRCAQAKELMQRSVAALVVVDRGMAACAGVNLALVEANLGDYATAERCAAESLEVGREMDETPLVAAALATLGKIACLEGCHSPAQESCEEALGMFQVMGARYGIADCLNTLGCIALALEDYETAREHLGRAQAIAHEIGAMPLALEVQVNRAELVLAELEGAAPGKDATRQVEELLEQPLHDARASVHTRERAEKVQARLQALLRP